MSLRFVLASNNAKKLRELRAILSDMGMEVISQREAGCDFEVEETGSTFAENSLLKARAAALATGMPAIADDSGLCVDALSGAPGVFSARYGGEANRTDVDRYEFLLKNMENKEQRGARFVSCVTAFFPNGDVLSAEGTCEGSILRAPVGEGGFGYDPIFLPAGFDRSMAELSAAEKDAISHRGNALRLFQTKLEDYLNKGR